jgi:hypothetical protein
MFTKFYDELYNRLAGLLTSIMAAQADPVKRLSEALHQISEVLSVLRTKVLSIPFPSKTIEILFFKTIKPKFYALKIFHFEIYNLDMSKPVGTKDMLLDYYRQELLLIQRFFKLNAFLYQYYRSGFSDMDSLYFVRGAEIPNVLVPEMPDVDAEFSTSMDYLFARFRAFELLQGEILNRISGLDGPLVPADKSPVKSGPVLKWIGSQVNLVELIYGLYYTLQLKRQGGDVEIKHIVALMETTFQIQLTDAHHSFIEIRRRKVISPTRFLESMVAAIQQRVDEDLEFKPNRGPKLRK